VETLGYVESPLSGTLFGAVGTGSVTEPQDIYSALALYGSAVVGFFQFSRVFNHSQNTIGMILLIEDCANITIGFFNSSAAPIVDQQYPLGNITCDPLSPGGTCESAPMPVEQVPTLFGLPEDPGFASILASMFYIWYWISLADFGFTKDQCFDANESSSNPFVNQTLLDRYTAFMNDIAMPYAFGNESWQEIINPLPITESNQLQNSPLPFVKTYTCSQRQLKGWLSFSISVIAADTALVLGAYNIFIFVASYLQKRWDRKCTSLRLIEEF
jgi:hypothetical protein